MTDTRALLNRISAFRERLEQMPRLLPDKGIAKNEPPPIPLAELAPKNLPELPNRLGQRARQGLEDAQKLVADLRAQAADPMLAYLEPYPEQVPLLNHHRETCALLNGAVRMIRYLPEEMEEQWLWCESLEAGLASARLRLATLHNLLEHVRRERSLLDGVSEMLAAVHYGRALSPNQLDELTERLMEETASTPLRWLDVSPREPARYIARHAILVCRILKRMGVAAAEPDLERGLFKAALLCDIGMIRLPVGLIEKTETLTKEERRLIEYHAPHGAEMIRRSFPKETLVAEAIAEHHERGDGTGYPNAWPRERIRPEARLLAIADVYAAMIEDRPYRDGCDPRTALTDTLLMAEKGGLDSAMASSLLNLGFHPVGSVVELADGSLAGVLARPRVGQQPNRPTVGLLADEEGRMHPTPITLDLSDAPGHSIVRTLAKVERRQRFAHQHIEWTI